MKKIEYKAPKMEVIMLKAQAALLQMSSGDSNIPTYDD